MSEILLWPEAESLLGEMSELLRSNHIDPGCVLDHYKDVAPLGEEKSDAVRPLDDLGRAAVRLLVAAVKTILPWPEQGPAHLHVAAASWLAALARLTALTLPSPSVLHPADRWRADVRLEPGEHDLTWRPDRLQFAALERRLESYLEDAGFVDAVAVAGVVADVHDAARAYAAEVELVDALHGIRFETALLVSIDEEEG